MNIGSGFGSQNSIQYLVDQYMRIESQPKLELLQKKSQLNAKKAVFSELDSKLSALKTKLTYFTDSVFNPFQAKSAASSDTDKATATAESLSGIGNHSVTVDRLAAADTRVSDLYTSSDSSFTSYTTDQTFTIEVGHPTDSDPANREQISVTVSADVFSDTNDNVLEAIADAIESAMAQAVADETIDSDEVINASVVNEESGTSRLVFRSAQTGYTYRMDFGGSSNLLTTLGIDANQASSGSSGGYMTYVGTSETDSLLNSKFTLDGLTFYRDGNSVDDALTGVTLNLLDTFSQSETITISSDTESVQADVQDFIDKYNAAISYLREQTRTNPDTHTRGPLSSDVVYRSMISDMRNLVSSEVTSASSDSYTLLYHIGIEANQDGTLVLKDSDKLTRALEANPNYVSDLFNSSDGVATRLEDYIDDYVKTGGTIDSNKENLDSSIRMVDDRIDRMEELLAKKEKSYFEEFSKLQETMLTLQNQQTFFSSFLGG